MVPICLACRMDTWPLERHRIALITEPQTRPLPKAWIWLCQPCVRRVRAGEPLGAAASTVWAPTARALTTDGVGSLTRREREIAALVGQGLSNREIGERLVLTPGTVANHVAHIMRRIGLRSRVEIAVWWMRSERTSTNGHDGTSPSAASEREPDLHLSPPPRPSMGHTAPIWTDARAPVGCDGPGGCPWLADSRDCSG